MADQRIEVPLTQEDALRPEWLNVALADVSGGLRVTDVGVVEVIRTAATKIRFTVRFGGIPERHAFCIKGFLDDEHAGAAGQTMIREANFYTMIAPHLNIGVPDCIAQVIDHEASRCVIIMRDVIDAGGQFNLATLPISIDEVADGLGQLAALHQASALSDGQDWIARQLSRIARSPHRTVDELQDLLDGPRGVELLPGMRSAENLLRSLRLLAEIDERRPQYMIHGDCHAGNSFKSAAGVGLIDWQMLQRGGWALDTAYHINSLLTVRDAENNERDLFQHYLDIMRAWDADFPTGDDAWLQYRQGLIYGYYMWAITRRVDPFITNISVNRLGQAVGRHDCFSLVRRELV